jgi:hypothetical protein
MSKLEPALLLSFEKHWAEEVVGHSLNCDLILRRSLAYGRYFAVLCVG